ncbi:MAG: superoxide dismutase [Thermoanaerobaculales bacterium]|jgi:Fe-Mn family superoxide dismutase|nr:superoxide dismutase [Thermoanaerobaculales bacterium]
MPHELPPLPYGPSDLEPFLSSETLAFHHGKHHRAYVDNLNRLIAGTPDETVSLEDLVRSATGGVFNNAAQVWNHTFYWRCLKAGGGGQPSPALAARLTAAFGSVAAFETEFSQAAAARFGSGWAWLVRDPDGSLAVTTTGNADTPLRDGRTPLLTCDVWEHAYYIDYRNARPKYLAELWSWVDWDFVEANLTG